MATAERHRRSGRRALRTVAVVAVPLAAAVTAFLLAVLRDPSPTQPRPVAVEATSIHHFADLAAMTEASDLVVVGTVVATDRGRLVGDPAGGGIVSRLVTVRVEQVLVDRSAIGAGTVLVEEEGWLTDGTPLVVNGLAPSATGDRGLWFLEQVATGEAPTFVVINEQGRYLERGGSEDTTVGADRRDPLIAELAGQPLVRLAAEVATLAG